MTTKKLEEKKTYFANLRAKRKLAKEATEKMGDFEKQEIEAIQNQLQKISPIGYMFCKMQLNKLWWDGLPGIDCKTFDGRKQNGFIVKKWEKSQLTWCTWIVAKGKDGEDEDKTMYPKEYKLFHRHQVEPIGQEKVEPKQEEIKSVCVKSQEFNFAR